MVDQPQVQYMYYEAVCQSDKDDSTKGYVIILSVLVILFLSPSAAKEQTDPGFVEKLVTQIVKNVQVSNNIVLLFCTTL